MVKACIKSDSFLPLLLACLFLAASSPAAASDSNHNTISVTLDKTPVKLISNVVYAQKTMRGYDNVPLRMDILRPDVKGESFPAVVFITGGGFVNANKDSYAQQRMELAEAGFVVASIEYRVAPTVLFPAPLEDVKSAIRFLRANAKRFGIVPEKIATFGASAGGYLAALAGTTNGDASFDVGEHLDQNSSVQAAIDFYGLSDLTLVGEGFPDDVVKLHALPSATEALWVNGAAPFYPSGSIFDHPDKAAVANPITHISSATPPFLIMHGDVDTVVSPRQTERLHEALTKQNIDSTYYVVQGARHGGVHWIQPDIMRLVIDFLGKHLKD